MPIEPDDGKEFGCGGLCCEQDITEPNGSIALNPGARGDACLTSCCAPEVFLHNHTDSKVGAGRNAGAHASGSSYPPQASTMRRRIGKEVNHKGRSHGPYPQRLFMLILTVCYPQATSIITGSTTESTIARVQYLVDSMK